MRRRKKIKSRSNREVTFKVVLATAIVLFIAVALAYLITGITDREELPEQGHVSGSANGLESAPGSQNTTDPDNGSDPEDNTPSPPPPAAISVINIAESYPELQALLDAESASHRSIGVSLVIYDDYKGQFYAYQYGHADREAARPVELDTKFRIASLSKFVVVICAMRLVDDGLLDLDEDISAYLGYNVRNPSFPNTPITSRMLMQHTSSIFDSQGWNDSNVGSSRNATQRLLTRNMAFSGRRPGTYHYYTNFGIAVLGAVVELISGKRLDAFVNEVLFAPLDIDAAFLASNVKDKDNIANIYRRYPDGSLRLLRPVETQLRQSTSDELGQDQTLGFGSLVISALDYAKIMAMLGNGGIFLGERILSPEAVAEIHNADVSTFNRDDPPKLVYNQGLSTRFTSGGTPSSNALVINDTLIWRYVNKDGTSVQSEGFYWHTGSAWGLYSQYIYIAGAGTDEGASGTDTSRGVVVITTGANERQASNGMRYVCIGLSALAWRELEFDKVS